MGASAFYGSPNDPNSQINVQAGPGYSYPGGGGFNFGGILEKLMYDRDRKQRRAEDDSDWQRELQLWQLSRADKEPTDAQRQMEAMALAERAADLEAKVNPTPTVYTAPAGVAPFTTIRPEGLNYFQKNAGGIPAGTTLTPNAIPPVGTGDSILGGNNIGQTREMSGPTGNAEVNAGPSVAEKAAADRKRQEQIAFSLMTPADQLLALAPYKGLQGGNS